MKQLASLPVALALALVLALAACAAQPEPATTTEAATTTTQQTINQELLESFMGNLPAVRQFMGMPELEIAQEDIEWHENLVAARGDYDRQPVNFTFRYYYDYQNEIRWVLLEYGVNWVGGPGFLDAGRSRWRWEQDKLFTEPFNLRVTHYLDLPGPVEHYDKTITPENWQQQVIDHISSHTGTQLADIWYEESRLVADVTPASAIYFNWGTTGGGCRQASLIESLKAMPNVSEIVVLIGGQRGMYADHFSFAEVFQIDS